jgi:hypothetical protein
MDRSSIQKKHNNNKEILELNDTIKQMDLDLTDVYTLQQHKIAAHGSFSKINHIVGHKASLNKYKKTEITPCILSKHNAIKLELNKKSSSRKYANTWWLNCSMISGSQKKWEEIKKFLEFSENENTTYQNLWDTANAVLEESL